MEVHDLWNSYMVYTITMIQNVSWKSPQNVSFWAYRQMKNHNAVYFEQKKGFEYFHDKHLRRSFYSVWVMCFLILIVCLTYHFSMIWHSSITTATTCEANCSSDRTSGRHRTIEKSPFFTLPTSTSHSAIKLPSVVSSTLDTIFSLQALIPWTFKASIWSFWIIFKGEIVKQTGVSLPLPRTFGSRWYTRLFP